MLTIYMIYEGKDKLSLCTDIKRILPDLGLDTIKSAIAGDATLTVNEEQLRALMKLERLYGTFAVGKA